jgi:hypothetical protein
MSTTIFHKDSSSTRLKDAVKFATISLSYLPRDIPLRRPQKIRGSELPFTWNVECIFVGGNDKHPERKAL